MSKKTAYVGIDVSKDWLDVFSSRNGAERLENKPSSAPLLFKKLPKNSLIALEASGGYEIDITQALREAGATVLVLNPKRVRDFARSKGLLAKTDQLDAQVIAQFAETIEMPQRTVKTQAQEELTQLTQRRNDLVSMRSGEKCRLKQSGQVKDSIKRHLSFLEGEIQLLEKEIHALIEKNVEFKHQSKFLKTVKGVGPVLISTLLGQMPELAELNEKQAASLAGLAPFNCDSGLMRGKRRIYGGRKSVRNALYNAANVSRRYDPTMKAFYERLIEKGKPFKVAIVACARKLLCWLNAILRRNALHTS